MKLHEKKKSIKKKFTKFTTTIHLNEIPVIFSTTRITNTFIIPQLKTETYLKPYRHTASKFYKWKYFSNACHFKFSWNLRSAPSKLFKALQRKFSASEDFSILFISGDAKINTRIPGVKFVISKSFNGKGGVRGKLEGKRPN